MVVGLRSDKPKLQYNTTSFISNIEPNIITTIMYVYTQHWMVGKGVKLEPMY